MVMKNDKKPLFYACPLGHGNNAAKKCSRCGKPGIPIYELPAERNLNTDPSYLDYILKNRDKEL